MDRKPLGKERYTAGRIGPQLGGAGFEQGAAGRKRYGAGRPMPNVGKVGKASAVSGYNERDVKAAARRSALIRRAGRK